MKQWVFSEKDTEAPSYLNAVEEHEDYFLVRLKGAMGKDSLERNRPKMTAMIKKFDLYSKNVLCDFKQVTEADTATVASLVSRLADFKLRKNTLIFFNVPERLKVFMDVTKVAPYFRIYGTLEEALEGVKNEGR